MSDLLSVREAARCAEASEKTVRRWLKAGKVRGLLIGGEWRVLREDLVVGKAKTIAAAFAHTNGTTHPAASIAELRDLAAELEDLEDEAVAHDNDQDPQPTETR